MKKLEAIKSIGGLAISVGVGAIVSEVISGNVKVPGSAIKKCCIMAGSIVLSNMIADKAVNYAEEKFDNTVNGVKEMVKNGELD